MIGPVACRDRPVPMDNEFALPSRLIVLREAMGRTADMLRQRRSATVAKTRVLTDIGSLAGHHLNRMAVDVERLGDEVNHNLSPAVNDPDSTRTEIERAVVRLQVRIEQLLDNYDELRRLNADADDIRGWRLLTEIYRDMLGQIQRWLDDIVAGLDDAQAALSSRMDGGGQDLQVTVPLNMTAPPEVEELTDWMERCAMAHESEMWERDQELRRSDEHRGCLPLVAAFLFGWIIGG